MNEAIKAEWVANLRSGEYEQGKGALETYVGTFCCLGVLCDMAVKANITFRKDLREAGIGTDAGIVFGDASEWNSDLLPAKVMLWAGLSSPNPRVEDDGEYEDCRSNCAQSLADLNDGFASFSEIADLIESQL